MNKAKKKLITAIFSGEYLLSGGWATQRREVVSAILLRCTSRDSDHVLSKKKTRIEQFNSSEWGGEKLSSAS